MHVIAIEPPSSERQAHGDWCAMHRRTWPRVVGFGGTGSTPGSRGIELPLSEVGERVERASTRYSHAATVWYLSAGFPKSKILRASEKR